jgi:hypothetical protein
LQDGSYNGRLLCSKWSQLNVETTIDTWEAGVDRKTIAQRERKHSHFLVLYNVKQLGSGCRSIATEDSCE